METKKSYCILNIGNTNQRFKKYTGDALEKYIKYCIVHFPSSPHFRLPFFNKYIYNRRKKYEKEHIEYAYRYAADRDII